MTKQLPETGFAHNPDPIQGVDAKLRKNAEGGVTVSFEDGSPDLNVSRREFMRISGVAAATAAMSGAGCSEWRNDVDHIVPFVDRPAAYRVGTPNHYASICSGCTAGCGILVTTRGGRPVKLEGNPNHPVNRGALCSRGQASYLNLYDPDRARTPLKVSEDGKHSVVTWEALDAAASAALSKPKGGIAILTKSVSSSATLGLIADLGKSLSVKHYQYDAVASEALLAASEACYGSAHIPHYDFSKADYVVALGSDFLGSWLSPVEFTKQFASRRTPDGGMNKLVSYEAAMSLTGANADERFQVRPSDLVYIALGLAHTVIVTRNTGMSSLASALAPFTPAAVAAATGVNADALAKVGQSLADHAGKSLVIAGGLSSATETGLALEVVVNILNAALKNEGVTIDRQTRSHQQNGSVSELKQLVADIDAGKISALIIDGANPIYNAPANIGFEAALKKVDFVISTTDRVDETSKFADYLAPSGHALENWGDSNPQNGVYALQQPTTVPVHDIRGFGQSLLTWFASVGFADFVAVPAAPSGNRAEVVPVDPGPWHRYLRAYWEKNIFPQADGLATFDQFWEGTLRQGIFISKHASAKQAQPSFNLGAATKSLPKAVPPPKSDSNHGDLAAKEIVLYATPTIYDGEHANNGHLLETPDVIMKTVWNSYAMVSGKTFAAAKLEQGQYLSIKVGDVEQKYPVLLQPGMHDDVIALPLGFGREAVGVVGNGVGSNAFRYTKEVEGRRIFGGIKATVSATSDGEKPSIVQGAQMLDLHRRPIFASTTLGEYTADKTAGKHKHPDLHDMWEAHNYAFKWGMAIDMSKCTGCSACVTACQEENNIPVVGLTGILEGREMHWMRIDRYYEVPAAAAHRQTSPITDPMLAREPITKFATDFEEPRVWMQPMLCQHCENAPCETVCPVAATMHSEDGLNQMAYNRCVGTRYCANNCPFKVRRYNWFSYTTDRKDSVFARLYPELKEHTRLNIAEPLSEGFNPEVTVRSRGVMEKCTFCVQRIRRAKWQYKEEGRTTYAEGDVVVACQQSCPADAIEFGNLMDENSAVAKLHAKARAVTPLDEIGVKSSVAYLTSVWNTEPAPHHDSGHGAKEEETQSGNAH